MEIPHLKNTVPDLKNSVESFRSRLGQAEEIICGIENRTFEIILSQDRKEKRKRKNEKKKLI